MQDQMGQFGYGMLGMGLPSGMLGGFGYAGQSGTFGQVRACFVRAEHSCSVGGPLFALLSARAAFRTEYIGLCAAALSSFPKCEYSADAWGILACCPLCCSFGRAECPDRTHRVRGQSTCHSVCRRTIKSRPFWTTQVYPRSPQEVVYFCLSLMRALLLPSMPTRQLRSCRCTGRSSRLAGGSRPL